MIIILLGLELVTGSFALVPLAAIDGRISWGEALVNLAWVFPRTSRGVSRTGACSTSC